MGKRQYNMSMVGNQAHAMSICRKLKAIKKLKLKLKAAVLSFKGVFLLSFRYK